MSLRPVLPPKNTKACAHCTNGSWTDSNGIQRRCHYCNGTGRVKS